MWYYVLYINHNVSKAKKNLKITSVRKYIFWLIDVVLVLHNDIIFINSQCCIGIHITWNIICMTWRMYI